MLKLSLTTYSLFNYVSCDMINYKTAKLFDIIYDLHIFL